VSGSWSWSGSRNCGSWTGSPPKFHRLVLCHWPLSTPSKISSKFVRNFLRYFAYSHFMPYLLMVKNPRKWSRIQKECGSSPKSDRLVPGPRTAPPKNSSKSVHNLWRYFADTRAPSWPLLRKHHLLGGLQYSKSRHRNTVISNRYKILTL